MDIPQQVQDKLKCSECDELLSCGPVYLLHETGGTICGRCSQQSEDSKQNTDKTRIEPYEAVASLLAFPCAFAAQGCPQKHSFTLGQPPHELTCKFRPFICPIAPRGSCEWIGSLPKLQEHCDELHPTNILKNPCNPPRPDLTTSNLQTYLITAFHFLFLLHVKVCVASGKLFHSVRVLSDSKSLNNLTFTLDIEGNNIKMAKTGSVLRAGLLTIQEPTAICTTINSLLDILCGKYDECKFTITIKTAIRNCLNCSKIIENVSEAKFCEMCRKKIVKCELSENNCSFTDVNNYKCKKHRKFFCEYQTKCGLVNCGVKFVRGSFIEHLCSSSHETIKSNIDSVVRITDSSTYSKFIVFSTDVIGIIICEYYLFNSNLYLYLFTSLPSHDLKNFQCSIKLYDPRSKYTQIFKPKIEFNNLEDWSIYEKMNNFPSWKNIGIDLKIIINKI